MDSNCETPFPISLNCWKHHAGFIKEQITLCKKQEGLENLKSVLLKVGDSQMDLYIGTLSTNTIAKSITQFLHASGILNPASYKEWLNVEGTYYRLYTLSDKSVWTLRFGEVPERFVHVHPGRNSPHTTRVRALTLKTAIILLCWKNIYKKDQITIDVINKLREKYLNEPPIKIFSRESGLRKLLGILDQ